MLAHLSFVKSWDFRLWFLATYLNIVVKLRWRCVNLMVLLDSVMTKMHNYQSIQSLDLTWTVIPVLCLWQFTNSWMLLFCKGKRNIISQFCILVAVSQEYSDLPNHYGDKNSKTKMYLYFEQLWFLDPLPRTWFSVHLTYTIVSSHLFIS